MSDSSPDKGERPCATCNGDPAVCAKVPGLRHCEKAMRDFEADADREMLWDDGGLPGRCGEQMTESKAQPASTAATGETPLKPYDDEVSRKTWLGETPRTDAEEVEGNDFEAWWDAEHSDNFIMPTKAIREWAGKAWGAAARKYLSARTETRQTKDGFKEGMLTAAQIVRNHAGCAGTARECLSFVAKVIESEFNPVDPRAPRAEERRSR